MVSAIELYIQLSGQSQLTAQSVVSMELSFRLGAAEWIALIDWVAFSRAATSLRHLRCLVVHAGDGSKELDTFMQYGYEPMRAILHEHRINLDLKISLSRG